MAVVEAGLACAGMLCAAGAGYCAWSTVESGNRRSRYRKRVRSFGAEGGWAGCLPFATASSGDAIALSCAVRASMRRAAGREGAFRLPDAMLKSRWYDERASCAGLAGAVSSAGFCEARIRLACAGLVVGTTVGATLSAELAALLCLTGMVWGWRLAGGAVRRRIADRAQEVERHLPEMLEVIALGMRSGLSFDRSLALYEDHFDTVLSREFLSAHRQWTVGLVRRDEALRAVADSYDSAALQHAVEGIVRSLRFGSSMVAGLEAAAREARSNYRTRRQEQIAKAPVKMMIPTGTLILPAMLILVLGPVLLELIGGYL